MVQDLGNGIFIIDTKPLGHEQINAAYLVKGSDAIALIDPGFPVSVNTVITGLKESGTEPEAVDYIVLTHTHIDHSGGAGRIAQLAPNAKVVTHQRGVFYLMNAAKIRGGSSMVFGAELSDQLGDPLDLPEERTVQVEDGDTVELGDKHLVVYYTPGHSGDHISLFEESTGTLFPGDTGCLHYPQLGHVLIPAGSPPIYRTDFIIAELERLGKLGARQVLAPHFGPANLDPDEFIARNIETVASRRNDIDRMFKRGMDFSQVVEKMRCDIIAGAGKEESEIPDFLSGVWLRYMLKTGLMGYMADILQYARDLRPFTESVQEEVLP